MEIIAHFGTYVNIGALRRHTAIPTLTGIPLWEESFVSLAYPLISILEVSAAFV
jgi:hypothetical protein